MKRIITLVFLLYSMAAFAQGSRSEVQSYPAMATKGELLGNVPPLRDTPPRTDYIKNKSKKPFEKRNYLKGNAINNPNSLPQGRDPLVNTGASDRSGDPEVIPRLNFEGLHDPSGVYPPDPNGDVGKDHYMQMVNTSSGSWLQIWDKITGASVYGPALSSTIWAPLESPSIGDPIVQYDQDAERWIILEIVHLDVSQNELLLAISDDSDPTGGWKAYRFQTLGFPDYPKLYVWNNAYFLTLNEIVSGNVCSGYALNRAQILAGENSFDLYRFEMPNYQAIGFQPATGADWVGGPPPPPGSPGYIFRVYDDAWDGGADKLQIWEVFVDWANIDLSHADGPINLLPEPFETRVCFGSSFPSDCIEQPNASSPRLVAFEDGIMYSAPYRNFGDHESVVFNHVADVSGMVGDGGDAAVRWYELRKTGAEDWQIYQQGTYAPDLQTNRFMGTINMDEAGNIGLGYSGVSNVLNPGLYVTGQRHGDPLGQMSLAEHTIGAGGGSHPNNRWGDYSSMSVDPYDGRTFWFTGEYQPDNSGNWGTRIGSFKVQRDTYDLKPELLVAPESSAYLGSAEQVKVRISNNGAMASSDFSISLYFQDNLVVTDNVSASIDPETFYVHTFSQTVAMPQIGQTYKFKIITHWIKDQFIKNDTLETTVTKLTSNDASVAGKANLPGLVCGTETDFSIILKNASGAPMHSAILNWRINSQPWQVYNWSGDLPAGGRDTIPFHATNILNGLNSLKAYTISPNGVVDEQVHNDSIAIKFFGNIDGTYLEAYSSQNSGSLHWEMRTLTNQLIVQGEVSSEQPYAQICGDDNQCYRLILKASNFTWNGHFVLKDIFGHILVEITNATTDNQTFTICTPSRKQVDLGPLSLVSPVTGAGLTASEPVTVQFRNFGLTTQSNVNLSYQMNGGPMHTETLAGPFTPGQTIQHTFLSTEDLSAIGGAFHFNISATVAGDENLNNDTISANVFKRYVRELEIVGIKTDACSDTTFAIVTLSIRNNGVGSPHTFDLDYTLNGIQQSPITGNSTPTLPDETEDFPMFVPNLHYGLNTLNVKLFNVDGAGVDEVPTNNSADLSFFVAPELKPLQVFLSFDSKPQETSWEILNSAGTVIASGSAYEDPFGGKIATACLEKDSCYVFKLHDSGGDGMDPGYVSLTLDNATLYEFSGGNFGSELIVPFCANTACANFSLIADITPATGANTNDGKIVAVPINGVAPFLFYIDNGDPQPSPVFDNLTPGLYHLYCVDANGCTSELLFSIGTVGTQNPILARTIKANPNPTIGIAHIEIAAMGNEKQATCTVFDNEGKKVQVCAMSRWDDTLHGNIALDRFPAGVYWLRVSGLDRIYTSKIVKR